ncbi:MAG TPA: DUF5615 family PIN-like protein [Pyrinomonadaceae bacterium]|nr:DUF5615 family PIN-like protein [Pyrinomonadaceae bacterium]
MSRILLDENLDWRLRRELQGHEVESVPLIGWAGLKNGELLARAELRFDVFITMDSNLAYQRNIAGYKIAVVVLEANSNRLADTRPLMTKVLSSLENTGPGSLITISS